MNPTYIIVVVVANQRPVSRTFQASTSSLLFRIQTKSRPYRNDDTTRRMRLARDLPETCPRLARDLPETCPRLARDLPETCPHTVFHDHGDTHPHADSKSRIPAGHQVRQQRTPHASRSFKISSRSATSFGTKSADAAPTTDKRPRTCPANRASAATRSWLPIPND